MIGSRAGWWDGQVCATKPIIPRRELDTRSKTGSLSCMDDLASQTKHCTVQGLSRQISTVADLCCIVTWRLVESVGRVFDPLPSSAIPVFEHVKDELAAIPHLLLATL